MRKGFPPLAFLFILLGCAFCFVGLGLILEGPTESKLVGAAVGAGGLAYAIWCGAHYARSGVRALARSEESPT